MTKINILSPLLADMIAAGEVVERPASVIKELAENSFDAGAKKVSIEFRNGGATYIRITDDGCGMSPEDAGKLHHGGTNRFRRKEHSVRRRGDL